MRLNQPEGLNSTDLINKVAEAATLRIGDPYWLEMWDSNFEAVVIPTWDNVWPALNSMVQEAILL